MVSKNISQAEQKIREELDKCFKKENKTIEEINEIHVLLENSLENYNLRDYLPKYNALVREFYHNY
jgi:hypothetical protein